MSSNKKTLEEAVKEDFRAGPKPISLEEYRKRQAKRVPAPSNVENKFKLPKRGGESAARREQIKDLHRILRLGCTKHQEVLFRRQLVELKKAQRKQQKEKLNKKQ